MENELIDSACIRRFAGIDLVTDDIPDATTILAFRHFLEKHPLGEKISGGRGALERARAPAAGGYRCGCHHHQAPPSTRNRKRERDPECTAPARATSGSLV